MKFISALAVTAAISYAAQCSLEYKVDYEYDFVKVSQCPSSRPGVPRSGETWADVQTIIDDLNQDILDQQKKIDDLKLECSDLLATFNSNSEIVALGTIVDPLKYVPTEAQNLLPSQERQWLDEIDVLNDLIKEAQDKLLDYTDTIIPDAIQALTVSKSKLDAAQSFQRILSSNVDNFDAMQVQLDDLQKTYDAAVDVAESAYDKFTTEFTKESVQEALTQATELVTSNTEELVRLGEDVVYAQAEVQKLAVDQSASQDDINKAQQAKVAADLAVRTMQATIETNKQAVNVAQKSFDEYTTKFTEFAQAVAKAAADAANSQFSEGLLEAQKLYRETYLDYVNVVNKALTDFAGFDPRIQADTLPSDDDFTKVLDDWFQSTMAVKDLTTSNRSVNLTDLCTLSEEYYAWRSTDYPIVVPDDADVACAPHKYVTALALSVTDLSKQLLNSDASSMAFIIEQATNVSKLSSSKKNAIESVFQACVCTAKAAADLANGNPPDINATKCAYDQDSLTKYETDWNFDVEATCGAAMAPYTFLKKYDKFSEYSRDIENIFESVKVGQKAIYQEALVLAEGVCTTKFTDSVADYAAKLVTASDELAVAVTELKESKEDLDSKSALYEPYKDVYKYRTEQSELLVNKQIQLADLTKEKAELQTEYDAESDADKQTKIQEKIDAKEITRDAKESEVTAIATLVRELSNVSGTNTKADGLLDDVNTANTRYQDAVTDEQQKQQTNELAKQRAVMQNDKLAFDRLVRDAKSKWDKLIKAAEPQCTKAKELRDKLQCESDGIELQIKELNKYKGDLESQLTALKDLSCGGLFYDEAVAKLEAHIKQVDIDIFLAKQSIHDDDDTNSSTYSLRSRLEAAISAVSPACSDLESHTANLALYTQFTWQPINCKLDFKDYCTDPQWCLDQTFDFSKYEFCISDVTEYQQVVNTLLTNIYDDKAIKVFNDKMKCAGMDLKIDSIQLPATWTPLFDAANLAEKTAETALDVAQEFISKLPKQIADYQAQVLDLTAKATKAAAEYALIDFKLYRDAQKYFICTTERLTLIPGIENKIVLIGKNIAEELIFQSTKFASYWDAFEQTSEDNKTKLEETIQKAQDALKASNTDVFPIATLTDYTVQASDVPAASRRLSTSKDKRQLSDRRQLADYESNDLQMLNELKQDDRFSKFTACTKTNTDTSNLNIVGFQSYFGASSAQQAGPAHGDNVIGCKDYTIKEAVKEIQIYYSSADSSIIEGMSISFQGSESTIKIGSYPLEGQTRKSKEWLVDEQFQFFGFKTNTDDSTYKITSVEIVEYDLAEFITLKKTVEETPSQITAEEVNIQASIDGQREWQQIAVYEQVIVSSLISDLEVVTPQVITIERPLYPEEAVRQQLQIDAQVREIDEERFQVATEKANTQAAAATVAAAARKDFDDQVAVLTQVPDYTGHTEADFSDDLGTIVALIIGFILLVVVGAFFLYNHMMAKKNKEMRSAKNGPKIKVNQSSYREEDSSRSNNPLAQMVGAKK